MTEDQLVALIRNIPDFPVPGIQFKDITPLLRDKEAFRYTIKTLAARYAQRPIDVIVGIESRGFIFGAPLAYELGIGFVPVRKPGKLPADTYLAEYALEYGVNKLEIHRDAFDAGMRTLVIDDLLATGGTISATCGLVEQAGGIVEEVAFLVELTFLNGRAGLQQYPIFSLIQF
jgi:adenine phosphoribosyltransferase